MKLPWWWAYLLAFKMLVLLGFCLWLRYVRALARLQHEKYFSKHVKVA